MQSQKKPKGFGRLYQSIRWKVRKILNPKVVGVGGGIFVCYETRAQQLMGIGLAKYILNGKYEIDERTLLGETIRPDDKVLEVGAGIGVTGIEAARIVGQENVLSYEASPRLEWLIKKNHNLNDIHPQIIMKAVTKHGGKVNFYINDNDLSGGCFSLEGSREIQIDSIALKTAISDFDPTILVMDAEGAEIELLPEINPRNIRAVLVELHTGTIGVQGIAHIESTLNERGFIPTKRLHTSDVLQNVVFERSGVPQSHQGRCRIT